MWPNSLLPAAHWKIGDGVEVGTQHFGILEELVPEGVEPVQGDEEVSCCHPFLEKIKNKQQVKKTVDNWGNRQRYSPTSWKQDKRQPVDEGNVWAAAT